MNAKFSNRIWFQQGFSLVEIMVALTLGAIILLGVTQIFTNNSRTRAEIDRTATQIESGSYALGLIESDLTSAGFWGEAGEQPAAGTLPPVCPGLGTDLAAAGLEMQESLGYPVQGAVQGGGALASTCAVPKAGSEFLAVRRTSSCGLNPDDTGCAPISSNFYLQVNACFEPSDSSLPLPGLLLISTNKADLDYTQRDCATLAPRYQLFSRVYYVNASDVLVRAELDRASSNSAYQQTPLVEGVETMRFEYGVDTDDDGQVDLNTATPTEPQWADVVMVRVWLVVRNLKPTPGYSDDRTYVYVTGGDPNDPNDTYTVPANLQGHKRQVYARTVSVRNTAGRREVQ